MDKFKNLSNINKCQTSGCASFNTVIIPGNCAHYTNSGTLQALIIHFGFRFGVPGCEHKSILHVSHFHTWFIFNVLPPFHFQSTKAQWCVSGFMCRTAEQNSSFSKKKTVEGCKSFALTFANDMIICFSLSELLYMTVLALRVLCSAEDSSFDFNSGWKCVFCSCMSAVVLKYFISYDRACTWYAN